jgi:hypothetical protein
MTLDPRINPVRPDLAAARLRGRVEAARFTDGEQRRVLAPAAPVRRHPARDAALDTEALMGERVTVYDSQGGFAWVQLEADGYVGYCRPMRSERSGRSRTAASARCAPLSIRART